MRHVGQKLALELGGPLELHVLGSKGELVATALGQHRGPVQSNHDLIAQDLEQLQVVVAEGPAVPPVVNAHRADGDAGGAQGDDRGGLQGNRDAGGEVAPGIGVHIIRDQRGVLGDSPSDQRLIHRNEQPHGRLERTRGRHQPEESALLDDQGHPAAFGLEQIGRRLSDLLDQAVQVRSGQQRSGQMAQPLQLSISAIGLGQRGPQAFLLNFRKLPEMAEGDEGQEGGHRGEQQPHRIVPPDQPQAQPRDDDRDARDGAGIRPAPPSPLDASGDPAGEGNRCGGQLSFSLRSS